MMETTAQPKQSWRDDERARALRVNPPGKIRPTSGDPRR